MRIRLLKLPLGRLLFTASLFTTSVVASDAVDVAKLGPQVGERVPGFTLMDQTGKTRTLESIMGPNGAMLVFYRSADW